MVIALKEAEHRAMIAQDFDGWQDRVSYWNVHDIDEVAPSSTLPELQQLVTQLVVELKTRDGFTEI
jgi:protein-tyrosine phosphatase